MITVVVSSLVALIIGIAVGFLSRKLIGEAKIESAESEAKRIVEKAAEAAESAKKTALLEAKDQILNMRSEAERSTNERRNELQKVEKKITQKEEAVDEKLQAVEVREKQAKDIENSLGEQKSKLETLIEKQKHILENVAGLSTAEARELLLSKVQDEIKHETAIMVRDMEAQAREDADKRARSIVALSIQRCAADHVAETTVSVVPLPGDEMKGRIIGREGRNIRAFETLTGINLIIDDTPEAVILSSFDPVRREVGRLTLEKLIADGRIHPARIEEMFEKSKVEVEAEIRELGEQATFETDIHGLHPELVRVLGRLRYRTSYGQNVLKHSIEVAHLSGIMAAELGADVTLAKRAGLLHDIGKAIDHQVEGPHAVIGADLARRLNETPFVIHAIEAHHADVEPKTVEAVLVQSADAISAARPGARRETLESYVKRLENLENLAESHEGVEKCYAMQAGRELRIMVKPEQVDDAGAALLARDIAKNIEDQLEYPGQIKVTVIRENRAVEYAK
ncbi:MAG: ribonuclease Y [Actinomycetota bacterium]|nr:ribonuclease Y [Actinomycetota bacterium]